MAWDFGYGFDQEDPRLKLIRQMDPGMFPGILSAGQPAQTPGTGLLTALPEDAADRGSYASLPPSRPIDINPRAPTPPPIQRSDAGNVVGPPQAMASGPVTQPATSSADPLASIMGGIGANSDRLMALGAGLMSGKNWGEGFSKGIEGMQAADKNAAVTGLARQKLGQQQAGQNATLAYLMSKGMSKEAAVAAALNPAVLGPMLSDMKPQLVNTTTADGKTQQQWVAPGQPAGVAVGAPKDDTKYTFTDLPDGSKAAINPSDPSDIKIVAPGGGTRPITPEERAAYGFGPTQAAAMTPSGPKALGSGTSVTVNSAVNPVLKGLGDQFVESSAVARSSADAVRAIQSARSQLEAPGGIIAGSGADARLSLQKLGAALGVADPTAIQNTETFRTQIKPIVLETVKGLGAGSGISNADRDFALQAVGGDINLDPGTIKRVLDVTERAARSKIDRHNTLSDSMLKTQPQLSEMAPMLRVEPPATTPMAASPGTPGAGLAPGGSTVINGITVRRVK